MPSATLEFTAQTAVVLNHNFGSAPTTSSIYDVNGSPLATISVVHTTTTTTFNLVAQSTGRCQVSTEVTGDEVRIIDVGGRAGLPALDGSKLTALPADVVYGPATATDNAIPRYDTATGELLQNSGVSISDANEVRHVGTVEWNKGSDIAAATTLVLGTDGNYFDVTGTTTITGISAKPAGTQITLHFDGIVTLTHNATSLRLLGDVNFTTAAHDHITLICHDGINWREINRATTNSSTTDTDAIHDNDFTAAEGFMRKTSAGTYEAIKSNLAATTDPTAADDWPTGGYSVGSRWINVTLDKEWVALDVSASAAVWWDTTSRFGTEYQYVEDLTLSTTTTQDPNWTNKITLTTPSTLPAGTYRVEWQVGIGGDRNLNADYCEALFEQDNGGTPGAGTQLGEAGIRCDGGKKTTVHSAHTGFVEVVLTAGVHRFDLGFRVSFSSNGTVECDDARIALWRIL